MRAIGIILAGGNSQNMRELTIKRAVAAMPVAANYRAIDFALSSMSNSGIKKAAVLTQYNSKSLMEHLSSSKWWDFGRKKGGLFIFTPMLRAENGYWYRGTADAIYQNISFLEKSNEPYVVIASGDGIYKLDYNKILEEHIANEADITVVVKEMPERIDVTRFGNVTLAEDGRIVQLEEKPLVPKGRIVSTGIYIMRRRLLMELLENSINAGCYDLVNDILIRYRDVKRIYAYKMKGYWTSISTVDAYYEANMRFLEPEFRKYYFEEYPDVHSKTNDLPPVKYNPGATVRNSLVGSGSIVNGTVENSILFKNVFVGKGSTIRNSIVLNNVYLGENTYIENCIIESRGLIRADSRYIGEDGISIVIGESTRDFS